MLPVLIGAAATCALMGVVSFVLYARARMKEQATEAFYLRMHYWFLFLLFVLGIAIMFYMGEYAE